MKTIGTIGEGKATKFTYGDQSNPDTCQQFATALEAIAAMNADIAANAAATAAAEAKAKAEAEAASKRALILTVNENGQLKAKFNPAHPDYDKLGHFPVLSLYGVQLAAFLTTGVDEIKAFVEANKGSISATWPTTSKAAPKARRA